MANSVTIRTTAPGAKEAAGQLGMLKTQVVGMGTAKAGPLGGMASGFGGAGVAMLGAVGAGLAIGAVLTDVGKGLGDAANAAIADEKSVASLTTALHQNVPAWDGNLSAINKVTNAGIALGFADDASRASIQKLVIATGDITKSLYLYSLAQDVARGKGVDLATATDIVMKANIGNSRALKQMGIDLGNAATSTELLGALETRFAGQADTYAKTREGHLVATNEKFNELQETIGYGVLPVIDQGVSYFDNLATAGENAGKAINEFFHPGSAMSQGAQEMADSIEAAYLKAVGFAQLMGGPAFNDAGQRLAEDTFAGFKEAWAEGKEIFQNSARTSAGNLVDALGSVEGDIDDTMDDLMHAINHPLELEKRVADIQGALVSEKLQKALASKNPLIRTQAEQTQQHLIELWQELTGIAYNKGTSIANNLEQGLKTFNPPTLNALGGLTGGIGGQNPGRRRRQHRASGGAVDAGEPYIVGEAGMEEFVPDQDGTIIPHGQSRSGPSNIAVHVNLSTRDFNSQSKHYALMQGGRAAF